MHWSGYLYPQIYFSISEFALPFCNLRSATKKCFLFWNNVFWKARIAVRLTGSKGNGETWFSRLLFEIGSWNFLLSKASVGRSFYKRQIHVGFVIFQTFKEYFFHNWYHSVCWSINNFSASLLMDFILLVSSGNPKFEIVLPNLVSFIVLQFPVFLSYCYWCANSTI